MVSLPNIGFSLYPEEPVSTFRSVGKAAFPNITPAPSPFMAAPMAPASSASSSSFAKGNEREGLGLFAGPGGGSNQDFRPSFATPPEQTRPVAVPPAAPPVAAAAAAVSVSLAAFETLRKQVDALTTRLNESDPILKLALARISAVEMEMQSLRNAFQDDPFAGGIPMMFGNDQEPVSLFDLGGMLGRSAPRMPGGGAMTFTVLNEDEDEPYAQHRAELERWDIASPHGGSDGCEEYKSSVENDDGASFSGIGMEESENDHESEQESEPDHESNNEQDNESEQASENDPDHKSESEEEQDHESENEQDHESEEEQDHESENEQDHESENEQDHESESEQDGTAKDDEEKEKPFLSAATALPNDASLSSVRTISFTNTHSHQKQHKKNKQQQATAPAPARGDISKIAEEIVLKSERELSRMLVPELTEMLAVFGESYAPPKQESVALLLRRAIEAKAAASE